MKKSYVLCISILSAVLTTACSEKTVDFGCKAEESYCLDEHNFYSCEFDENNHSYWVKNKCDNKCDNKLGCIDCSEGEEKCENSNTGASYYTCSINGKWEKQTDCVIGCTDDNSKCKQREDCAVVDSLSGACHCSNGENSDGSCICPDFCAVSCNDEKQDGKCLLRDDCVNTDGATGACICANGNEPDGSCTCPDSCLLGCFEEIDDKKVSEGKCVSPANCASVDEATGACVCKYGNNADGSCVCPDNCVDGCGKMQGNDGTCKPRTDCYETDETGACVCVNGNNEDGSCKCPNCVEGSECNNMNGTCSCSSECKAGCHEDGYCRGTQSCMTDDECEAYNYCKSDLCICDLEAHECVLKDRNQNHMIDIYENLAWNDDNCSRADCEEGDEACEGFKCETKYGEKSFCDSFIGYKCSTRCMSDTQCMPGFICRDDGRCASETFTTVWSSDLRGHTLILGTTSSKCSVEICWDWKEGNECKFEPFDCSQAITHEYKDKTSELITVKIKINDEFNGFHIVNCFNVSNNGYIDKGDGFDENKGIAACNETIPDDAKKCYLEYRNCRSASDNVSLEQACSKQFKECKLNQCNANPDKCFDIRESLLEIKSFGRVGLGVVNILDSEGDEGFQGAFEKCNNLSLLSSIDIPDATQLNDMSRMFVDDCLFNFPIENWDVSHVTSMEKMMWMPSCYGRFNQSLEHWNVAKVTNMSMIFNNCESFNKPVGGWDVSNVTNMEGMFAESTFNQSIINWNVSNVTTMLNMFYMNSSFNQSLMKWNVSNVQNFQGMFDRAYSFNQDISGWKVNKGLSIDAFRTDNKDEYNNGQFTTFSSSGLLLDYFDNPNYKSNEDRKQSNLCKIYSSTNWPNSIKQLLTDLISLRKMQDLLPEKVCL